MVCDPGGVIGGSGGEGGMLLRTVCHLDGYVRWFGRLGRLVSYAEAM